MPYYTRLKPARFVHFSHHFDAHESSPACAVTVRPSGPGMVRLDFATLGMAWRGEGSAQYQTLAGDLRLQLQLPVKILGFVNTLRMHVHKPIGFRVAVFATLAGCHNRIDFGCDELVDNETVELQSASVISWTAQRGWENPPPYQLAIQLLIARLTGEGMPAVIVESLVIQAIEA